MMVPFCKLAELHISYPVFGLNSSCNITLRIYFPGLNITHGLFRNASYIGNRIETHNPHSVTAGANTPKKVKTRQTILMKDR